MAACDPPPPPGQEGAQAAAVSCPAPSWCMHRAIRTNSSEMKAVTVGQEAGKELAFSVKFCGFCLGQLDSQRGAA